MMLVAGRAEIAHRLGRSERTVSRWVRCGILPAVPAGPPQANLLLVRSDDLERVRAMFNGVERVA